ncbi:MAG: hypothetical protein ACI9H8_002129 [Lysobacterales bacterium]|jgi:hypothetical protein
MKHKISVLTFLLLLAQSSMAQVLTEWVDNNPGNDPTKLALGYPVPIPVDTPLPFDGFRTYAGLHMRHQDLQATTPWVHGVDVGTTHKGRTIWAYRLGDEDFETIYGLPEPAMLTNGGIHSREWQTPEVVTGILELMATHENDNHFYDYLRENVNMIVIPSLNIDGFVQTQRFPSQNYLQSDPDDPVFSPRDGRMRRKNLLNADEDLFTVGDHLGGVDLNRNNGPYWNTNPGRSSSNTQSLVHHGVAPQSEPETQALDVAAHLGPIEHLRLYTDVHSFSQVHFWVNNGNARLATLTEKVLGLFTNHHQSFPAGKFYFFSNQNNVALNNGIGTTDEYFTNIYQVPSWTLEVEPSFGNHPGLPGAGADYGGTNVNGHDGFILPESQIRRVREEMAQSFAAVYYQQAGPANIQSMRVIDVATQAVVYEAEWEKVDDFNRSMYSNQIQPLQLSRDYILWVAYSKPMRWRTNGAVTAFPGTSSGFLSVFGGTDVGAQTLTTNVVSTTWLDQPGDAPNGYLNYEDDAVAIAFNYPLDANNDSSVNGEMDAIIRNLAWDITGQLMDADPSTVAYWADGHWNGLENSSGIDGDFGGEDASAVLRITDETLTSPFVLEPGTAAAWGDPERSGEGFILEMLSPTLAVMFWFTNDDEGGQDWYIAVGEVRGNRILFPSVLRVSGGVFGDAFDPDLVVEEVLGSAKFIWSECDKGSMDWNIGSRHGRQNLARLTSILGLDCGQAPIGPPLPEQALFSGSWGDPTHDGEGFTVEMLENNQALVFWFSFGPDGKRRWYFGIGRVEGSKLIFDNLLTTTGGVFGDDFDPNDVTEKTWGTLELDLACAGGTAIYTSVEAGFDAGQQNVVKITSMDGLNCTP